MVTRGLYRRVWQEVVGHSREHRQPYRESNPSYNKESTLCTVWVAEVLRGEDIRQLVGAKRVGGNRQEEEQGMQQVGLTR